MEIGLSGVNASVNSANVSGIGHIWQNNIECHDGANVFFDCTANDSYGNNFQHSNDVSIICSKTV